jgi:UDP-N-acetylmuramoyl-tripeptide--D-alanyl-D-alanine ligase
MFGGRPQIAAAKGELVEALRTDGLAVLNADDPLVRGMAQRTEAQVVTFGTSGDADVRISPVTLDGQGRPRFRLASASGSALVRLRLVGAHQAMNAAAAAAVALRCAVSFDAVAAALTAATPRSRWRMEVRRRADGVTVINDAYNANPSSMRAALQTLTAIGAAVGSSGRTVAVLGEMRELGSTAPAEHEALGRLAMEIGVRRLVAVGPGAEPIHRAALRCAGSSDRSSWVPDVPAALTALGAALLPGDVVLVKASRAVGLERVAEALLGAEVTA